MRIFAVVKEVAKKNMYVGRSHRQRGNEMSKRQEFSSGIQKSIKTNDYHAFVIARNAQQASRKVPTHTEFNERVKIYLAHQSVELAILVNNYEAFKTALSAISKSGT